MSRKRKSIAVQSTILFMTCGMIYLIVHLNMMKRMPNCKIRQVTGLLCPTCGGTRCVIAFLEGNLKDSFQYHPIFFLTMIYLMIWVIFYILDFITGKKLEEKIRPKWYGIFIWVILLGAYTIYRNLK